MRSDRARCRLVASGAVLAAVLALGAGPDDRPGSVPPRTALGFNPNTPMLPFGPVAVADAATPAEPEGPVLGPLGSPRQVASTAQTMGLFALVSIAPAALLMLTAFVRISIVLTLLRQALGSPQVPGNQVLTALALMLTALVMRPVADAVYARGIEPYASGRASAAEAWEAGTGPIKRFMLDQIDATGHRRYLDEIDDLAVPDAPDRAEPGDDSRLGLAVVAPAFLLSELTTALVMGFRIYLPFLVIDLVVSAVLAAMGLFMLPPSLVALPLKLIVFVLADGWMLVAGMLLRSFAQGP